LEGFNLANYLAEFFGTMILLILGVGVVAGVVLKGTKSQGSGWIVITFGWGLAVMTAVYATGYISGAHINPAVTVAVAVSGGMEWVDAIFFIIAQMLGAFVGAAVVLGMYYPHYVAETDKMNKLGTFSTAPAIRHTPSNFFSEVVGTFVLLFGIAGINATIGFYNSGSSLAPLLVGLLVVVIGLTLGGTTGYAINPARDLGPRLAHFFLPVPDKGDSDWKYAWLPVVAPIIGGVLGQLTYEAVFNDNFLIGLPIFIAIFIIVQIATFFISIERD
jgi:glycerol uptake facilitator protein